MPRLHRSDYDALGPGRNFPSPDPSRSRLTPGERSVALLVADSLRNAEIADRLGRAPSSVALVIDAVKRRLGLATREELAAWVRARRMPVSSDGRLWRIGDTRQL
jgi:DNA-binding CsgD family transcriptional regulator